MMTTNTHKSSSLSNQVQQILKEKGFSFLFDWTYYQIYKKQSANAFNKALAIAQRFIEDNDDQSNDFSTYVF